MKTYWDYSEKERSEMTEEQVAGFLDCELMSKGVLKPEPLVLEPVAEVSLPTVTGYRLKLDWREIGPVFVNQADAIAVAAMPMLHEDSDYQTGRTFASPMGQVSVIPVSLPPDSCKAQAHLQLVQIKAAKERNEKAQKAFDTAQAAVEKATCEMWDDWHGCRAMASGHRRIISTFEEYTRLASGDRSVARKFLCKAFPEPAIADAFAWFGMEDTSAQAGSAEPPAGVQVA